MPPSQRISLAEMVRSQGTAASPVQLSSASTDRWSVDAHPTLSDLSECLFFSPGDGRIWLNDQRMLLIHSRSMGTLRRELIDNLGIDKARGLLTRAGYIWGRGMRNWCANAGPRLTPPPSSWPGRGCIPWRAW